MYNSSSIPAKLKAISYYTVLFAVVLLLGTSVYFKLTDHEQIVTNFSKWGLLEYKNYVAYAELVGVILLIIPRTTLFGTIIISAMMGGAIYTHISHQEPFFLPLAILLVLWIIFFLLRKKFNS